MGVDIVEPKVLIVEGKDEDLFFQAFLSALGVREIQILPIGGKTNLPRNLRALRNAPNFDRVQALGIVRDADTDPETAFQSVCTALRNANLPVPPDISQPSVGSPRTSIFIVPDSASTGMIEDLCLKSVQNAAVTTCIDQYLSCMGAALGVTPNNASKARVHAFLSAQIEADKRLGEAALAGYWPLTHQAFASLRQFLAVL